MPLTILGTFSIMISNDYVNDTIKKNNKNLLIQYEENIAAMLSEFDSFSLYFDKDPVTTKRLKGIMSSQSLNFDEYNTLRYAKSYIDLPVISKPSTHSINIYYDVGENRFLSSKDGLTNTSSSLDVEWFQKYYSMKNDARNFWSETRSIKNYEFEKSGIPVITLYKKLYTLGNQYSDGAVVMNIYKNHVDDLLKNLSNYDNQVIFIVNSDNEVLASNNAPMIQTSLSKNILLELQSTSSTMQIGTTDYSVYSINSEDYGWSCISLVPAKNLNALQYNLVLVIASLLVVSLLLCMSLAYLKTTRDYKQLSNIIKIFDAAENGHSMPTRPARNTDAYGFILHNLIKTFVQQDYLNVQLSEKKYKIQAMELIALQSQINPHFLNNTLHTIYWEVFSLTNNVNRACQMIENLTDILHFSLEGGESEATTLKEEIRYTQSYIELQKVRHKNTFDVYWEYPSEIVDAKVIKLVFQPLIENCISHGINDHKNYCTVKVRIRVRGSNLKISIIDNGAGVPLEQQQSIQDKLKAAESSGEHIGLFNTNKRLKLYYGDQYGIQFRSRHLIGTLVTVCIPYKHI